ncbi:MAG TPA: copper homeostasis protein CutC [Chitinophagales bacterium]|nr:copper homeostasis protein CutC [Chitinophagales bacterium]
MITLEICTFNATDVVRALAAGADRIELCASYVEGGITPSTGNILHAFNQVSPEKIVIMIRPRGGNFIYDDEEFKVMQQDIQQVRALGARQIIFGIIQENGRLDIERNKKLIDAAGDMDCTLQRAFDLTRDPFETLTDAQQIGFKRILTSGQKSTAWEGRETIKQLIQQAGTQIEILPGAGVNRNNAAELITYTGCTQIHTSAKRAFTEPALFAHNPTIYNNSHMTEVWPEEVAALKKITSA